MQFPTNLQPTTARTKNLSIVNADCCPKYPHDPPAPPVGPLAGQFSQFITELEYLVAAATLAGWQAGCGWLAGSVPGLARCCSRAGREREREGEREVNKLEILSDTATFPSHYY